MNDINPHLCQTCREVHADHEPCPMARWQLPAEVTCEVTFHQILVIIFLSVVVGLLVGAGIGAWWCG